MAGDGGPAPHAPADSRAGRPGRAADPAFALPHPEWLHHHLAAWGPPRRIAAFARAAAGAGVTPWLFDETAKAEDWAYLLFASRAGQRGATMGGAAMGGAAGEATMRGARALARRLARAVADEHDAAIGWIGISQACPFDLHRLVPVPPAILHQGAEHPAAQRWMWTQWGTTWPLRQVAPLPPEARPGEAPWAVEFWSADWSPWPALARIRADWPDLTFRLVPRYDNDGSAERLAWRARRPAPAASTGPASTGPASTGPASTGPASTPPASTAPPARPQTTDSRSRFVDSPSPGPSRRGRRNFAATPRSGR